MFMFRRERSLATTTMRGKTATFTRYVVPSCTVEHLPGDARLGKATSSCTLCLRCRAERRRRAYSLEMISPRGQEIGVLSQTRPYNAHGNTRRPLGRISESREEVQTPGDAPMKRSRQNIANTLLLVLCVCSILPWRHSHRNSSQLAVCCPPCYTVPQVKHRLAAVVVLTPASGRPFVLSLSSFFLFVTG